MTTRRSGSDSVDHVDLSTGLERLVSLVRRLSPAQGISLTTESTLHRLERDGPHRLSALANREGISQPAMTQLVSRLEREGYARRRPDPTDARAVVVYLTGDGARLVRERRAARARSLATLMTGLAVEDRVAIAAALPALGRLSSL